ncbi:hypothetical protein BU26DRAFT_33520 [Trematosphaeria pertusa]|uniref:Uncharacterized protein n=1 Tax=Trematosphaeria pertusa TaxID=390896 RepID=A0A6A6J677_9PLEO|nr:uncharacterized protein BU26DRAFT_33520 [Trematosphaeria pertusa]KAF2256993.1 hypothetical protein BU26DRAFT_33520 [Trematosphaeria pertusa]
MSYSAILTLPISAPPSPQKSRRTTTQPKIRRSFKLQSTCSFLSQTSDFLFSVTFLFVEVLYSLPSPCYIFIHFKRSPRSDGLYTRYIANTNFMRHMRNTALEAMGSSLYGIRARLP